MGKLLEINHNEIEKRKENIRRVWDYKKVDHIPIGIWLDDTSRYTLKEQCLDGGVQLEVNIDCINRCLKTIPDDYIPYARLWPGYITIGTMFGMEVHWSDDQNQAPGFNKHLITDMSQVHDLKMPDATRDGLMPDNIKWLRHYSEVLPKDVYITGIDLGGPMNTAKDLLDTNLLYMAFYDSPDEFHKLLDMATELQLGCYEEIIKAVGDINRLTCIDFDPFWAPEGRKGFVSDDVCASYSPSIFEEFSKPYNNRIFKKYGGGRIHNCGPHPSSHLYLGHDPEIKGLNCAFKYSKNDFPKFKEEFRGRGIIELNFDNENFDEIVNGYEEAAQILAPDVIAVPLLFLNDTWSDEALTQVYHELRKISEKYASDINWNGN